MVKPCQHNWWKEEIHVKQPGSLDQIPSIIGGGLFLSTLTTLGPKQQNQWDLLISS
jgi:hypothetical protein